MNTFIFTQAGEGCWGTDEAAINKVLSLRNYAQLRATFEEYGNIAGRDIEEAIDSECSGCLQAGMLAIGQCWCLTHVLCLCIWILFTLRHFNAFSVRYAKDPAMFFARRLYDSMKGAGTSDNDLIRVIVSRSEVNSGDCNGPQNAWVLFISYWDSAGFWLCIKIIHCLLIFYHSYCACGMLISDEDFFIFGCSDLLCSCLFQIDLAEIKMAFQEKYEQSLSDFVSDDVGGDYKKILLAVIGDA